MKISFAKFALPTEGALVVGVLEERVLLATAQQIDAKTAGWLTRAIAASRFEGKKGQSLLLLSPAGLEVSRLLLIGLGKVAAIDEALAEGFGGAAVAQLLTAGDAAVTIAVDVIDGAALSAAQFAAHAGYGAKLRSYRFDKYRTNEKPEEKVSVKKVTLALDDQAKAKSVYTKLDAIAQGVFLTRDLASEPANVIFPESLAAEAKKLAGGNATLTGKVSNKGGVQALIVNKTEKP